ncbi:hypothetical protein M8C21_015298, partial [Ambrosia artemisiifolia]
FSTTIRNPLTISNEEALFAQSTKLPRNEVEVLKEIQKKIAIAGWDFDKDPCSDEGEWGYYVYCDCSVAENNTCHVTEIRLQGNMLSGSFPTPLTEMTTLQVRRRK